MIIERAIAVKIIHRPPRDIDLKISTVAARIVSDNINIGFVRKPVV